MADSDNEGNEERIQTYRLRSSIPFIAAGSLLTALSLVPLGLIIHWNLHFDQSPLLWLLSVALLLTPILLLVISATYLIPGGAGVIRINLQGVELVTPKLRKRFPIDEIKTHITRHSARITVGFIPMATVDTDVHVRLEAQGGSHTFSRHLFEEPAKIHAFIDDLERIQRGQAPTGVTREQTQSATMRSDPQRGAEDAQFEAQLDAELDAMD